ncbi:MAG: N-acetylmuramoyl-L-alanine amidase [Verrucomicrobia bacterium]|nr:N-acetylmuramoyl-L-alanine amidase [Verrucomicrobiota bacterium]
MNILSVSATRFFHICAASAALVMASGGVAEAQLPLGPQDLEIVCPPSGGRFLRWQRKEGRTYFVQVSAQDAPLAKWTFLPLIEYGPDAEVSFEITASAPSAFFRLKYTDMPVLPGSTPDDTDFDGDGISTHDEIWLTHTDPLNADSDGDGMDDGWEDSNYLDPNDATGDNGSGGDPDHDGIGNLIESILGTKPQMHDTDGDGISDGGEQDIGTDPLDDTSRPDAEWVVVTAIAVENVTTTRKRTVTIPAGKSCVLPVVLVSDEYPNYTGTTSQYNDIVTWRIAPAGDQPRTGTLNVNSRHAEWEVADLAGISCHGFGPAIVEDGLTLTAPDDAPLEVEIEITSANIGDGDRPSTVMVGVLPIEPMEFFPVLLDGDGDEITGSQNPRTEPGQTNGMVEEDPAENRIAHREMRMRIVDGSILLGHTLTWSMEPLFMPLTGGPAVFRGDWAHAAEGHRDRFESSGHYGAHGFVRTGQTGATTVLGYDIPAGMLCGSAIRANLPPIGFNKGRLRVAIQGIAGTPAKVADIEVPPVIVIDPGHGGAPEDSEPNGSSWNNATSFGMSPPLSDDPQGENESWEHYCNRVGKSLEKNLTLLWGTELRTNLESAMFDAGHHHYRVVMTRTNDSNPWIGPRARFANLNGADVFFSIHFNANASPTVHGPETWIEPAADGNINFAPDQAFAGRINDVLDALVPNAQQPGESGHRGIKPGTVSGVYRDSRLRNVSGARPYSRACLAEIDFITAEAVENSLVSGAGAAVARDTIISGLSEAIIEDIMNQE